MLKETLLQMKNEVIEKISNAKSVAEVDELRVEFLGKKGKITDILKGLKDLSVEDWAQSLQKIIENKQKGN